ncbi:uncharacterized protein LOC111137504 isoform X4 [Crassostrea virginica]
MNGNGVNSPDKMDDFQAQFQPVPSGKPAPGLDPNAAPFEPFGEQSDLSNLQASDQSVPAYDLTQPANTATAPDQQPPDQPQSGGDGMLIDFGGKDEAASSSPAPAKGEGHIDPFSMDVEQMDHSASQGGQPFMDSTLPQGMGVYVEDSVDKLHHDQGASEMECQCDNYEPDQSLSKNVDDLDHSQNMNPSLSTVPHDVMESNVAQEEETVPASQENFRNQPAYQPVSSHDRNSFDEQIVPGVCSCTEEPEPETPQEETVKNDQLVTPQTQYQHEEECVDEEYYEEGSDEDLGEDQVEYQGVEGEDDEEIEEYTDDGDYSDEEEDYDDGPDSYRASEEREVVSDEENQVKEDNGEIAPQVAPATHTESTPVPEPHEEADRAKPDLQVLSTESAEPDGMGPTKVSTDEMNSERLSEETEMHGTEEYQQFSEERESMHENERMDEEAESDHSEEADENGSDGREKFGSELVDEVKPQEDNLGDMNESHHVCAHTESQYIAEKEESHTMDSGVSEEAVLKNSDTYSVISPKVSDEQTHAHEEQEVVESENLEKYKGDEMINEDVKEELNVDDIVVEEKPIDYQQEQVPDVILTSMQEPHLEVSGEQADTLEVGEGEEGEIEIQSNVSEFGSQYGNVSEFGSQYAEMGEERMDEEIMSGENGEIKDDYYPDEEEPDREREQEIESEDFKQQDVEEFIEHEERREIECVPEDVIPQLDQMENVGFDSSEKQMDIPPQSDMSHIVDEFHPGIVETPPDSTEVVQEPPHKAETFIESEGSDMEERSITPDPDQMIKMASPRSEVSKEVCDTMFHNEEPIAETEEEQEKPAEAKLSEQPPEHTAESAVFEHTQEEKPAEAKLSEQPPEHKAESVVFEHTQEEMEKPAESSKSLMEGSLIMDDGQGIEDAHPCKEAETEGNTDYESAPQIGGSAIEGSLIMDEGQSIEDAQHYREEDTEESAHHEMAPQLAGNAMEGSLMDEGQSVEDAQLHRDAETEESPEPEMTPQFGGNVMEGSLIMDEGQSIEDAQLHRDAETEESLEHEMVPQLAGNAMEGSLIMDEGQSIEDAQPQRDAETEESPEPEMAPQLGGNVMEGSLILDEGQTIEDAEPVKEAQFEESPDDEIVPPMSGNAMEGSLIMEEGQTIEDLPEEHTSVMEGSFVMEKGQTIEDLPSEQTQSVMEGSLIMDDGQTVDEMPQEDVMSKSLMEDSIVLDEGETFDNQEIQADHSRSTMEDTNTSEDSQASQKVNIMTGSMMEGSIVLDEDEKLEDRFPEDAMCKSLVEESETCEEGPTFEDSAANAPTESLSESYTESQTEESLRTTSIGFMDDEASLQRQTAQNMVENVLNDAVDKVESMQRIEDVSVEESSIDKTESGVEECIPEKSEEAPSEEIKDVSVEEPSMEKQETGVEESIPEKADYSTEDLSIVPVAEPPEQPVVAAEEKPKEKEEKKEMATKPEQKAQPKAKTVEIKKKEKVLKETKHVTKIEKDKKNVSVSKEHKKEVIEKKEKPKPKAKVPAKVESKPTSAKSETEKPHKDNKYSHITSRLTQETSASLARKTVKRSELLQQQGNSKLPSPEKADIAKRSQSATRQARSPQKPRDLSTTEDNKDLMARSKSTPRAGAHRGLTPSPMRGHLTTTRNARPTKLLHPRKDASAANGVTSPANGTEEEKAGKRTPSASSKKKYGIDSKNTSYKPGGGQVKIFDKKVQVKATPRIDAGAKTPTGPSTSPRKESPRPKPTTPKGPAPNVKNVTSRIGSLQNASYTPRGGQVKIATKKTDYSTVASKVGSTANMDHKPGGGEKKTGGKKILSQKLEWKTNSKIGSLDNAKHSPGGGNVKIKNEKVHWNIASKIGSLDNASYIPGGGNVKIINESIAWNAQSRVGSLDNKDHKPGGGNIHIESHKVEIKAQSKVGSTDYITHKPGGGTKKIETQKLDFKEKAKPRVESKTAHKPGGGDKKIETQKVNFKESAKSRTDSGNATPKPRTESVNSQDS